MKIGILGWGSLIADPRELEIENKTWCSDGPYIPVEFARISGNKRLTLVICPAFDEVQTYYAISLKTELDQAIIDLAKREGTSENNIAHVNFRSGKIQSKKLTDELKKTLSHWNLNRNFDALIWTDLKENFQTKINLPFTLENSLKYLASLSPEELKEARNYIINAPEQTITKHRKKLTGFLK